MKPLRIHAAARRFGVWLRWLVLVAVIASWTLTAHDATAQRAPRPWLGVILAAGDSQGVPIDQVVSGSPADSANLSAGDHILSVDGKTVRTPKDVIETVGLHQPGQVAHVLIVRGGQRYQASVLLTAMPSGEELLRRQRGGKPAPEFVGLASVSGASLPSIASLRGRVVVVDFWAPWCVACRFSIPHLNAWGTRYGSRGLSVLGVGTDEVTSIANGAQAWGITYPVVADPEMKTWRAYGVRDAPSLLVIDRRGVVRDVATGFDPVRLREIEALVERLLLEPRL